MRLGNPLPVRLTEKADERLRRLSAANDIKKAALIRLAVEKFLDEVEEKGQVDFITRVQGNG